MKLYRVNIIRSQRAVIREKLEHPVVEERILDTYMYEEAYEVYSNQSTGMETAKELISIDKENNEEVEVIETNY